jgi:stage III sporulation protein AA
MLDLGFLRPDARAAAERMGDRLCEIRLRADRPVQLVAYGGEDALCDAIGADAFRETVAFLMGYSLYACEDELARGYFTLPDGSRAGVCGAFAGAGAVKSVTEIGSVCIRIAREAKGCAEGIIADVDASAGTLIVSPPGLGKTTMLRDVARLLSVGGRRVCVIDERGEIAASVRGIPTLDVGPRTDVYALCPKADAIMMAVRACAPEVIVTDELGAPGEAQAALEAVRCGVKVVASAHGQSLLPARMLPEVARVVRAGAFELGVLLGPTPGIVAETMRYAEGGDGR